MFYYIDYTILYILSANFIKRLITKETRINVDKLSSEVK